MSGLESRLDSIRTRKEKKNRKKIRFASKDSRGRGDVDDFIFISLLFGNKMTWIVIIYLANSIHSQHEWNQSICVVVGSTLRAGMALTRQGFRNLLQLYYQIQDARNVVDVAETAPADIRIRQLCGKTNHTMNVWEGMKDAARK